MINGKPNILVVEDDKPIRSLITTTLETQNYKYITAENGAIAILQAVTHKPDIILLDLGLPDIDGVEVIKKIRTWSMMPIIVISARSDSKDKILALDAGADDYLTKPFYMEELKARIIAILKSIGKIKSSNLLQFKDMEVNMKTKRVYIKDVEIELNEKLYNLLEYLIMNKGVLLFKEQIFDNICGYNSDASTEIIEVYMSRLRKNLSKYGYDKYIVTKRGMGYLMDESIED